jgi:hypothetical protein
LNLWLSYHILIFLRIAQIDPTTDILYGSGYGTQAAVRYSWLLNLKERIPDEDVERETDKYWENYHRNTINSRNNSCILTSA